MIMALGLFVLLTTMIDLRGVRCKALSPTF